jgi:[acyl-carrier-protein] S-malonyltransferase
VIFSGQGNQHADMFPWVDSSDLLTQACRLLGIADWRQALADPVRAQDNHVAQVLLTALGLTVWAEVRKTLGDPAVTAGYSVGELASYGLAGVFSPPTAVELASRRAVAMNRSAARSPGGLVAVSGLAPQQQAKNLAAARVHEAIHIDADRSIVGGHEPGLQRFLALADAQGATCNRLRIALASHTPLMGSASREMAEIVGPMGFQNPRVCLVGHTGHRISTAEQARAAMAGQISTTVWWSRCMEHIASRQVRCVLEIGPSNALSRIWNRLHPSVPCRSADEFRSMEGMCAWIDRARRG